MPDAQSETPASTTASTPIRSDFPQSRRSPVHAEVDPRVRIQQKERTHHPDSPGLSVVLVEQQCSREHHRNDSDRMATGECGERVLPALLVKRGTIAREGEFERGIQHPAAGLHYPD